MERILLGSAHVYQMEFTGALPTVEQICLETNRLAYIKSGAKLEYASETYEATDDFGIVSKRILTKEEVTLSCGVMTFDGNKLKLLTRTARVSEDKAKKIRTVKVGGIKNQNNKNYVICLHHPDSVDGDIHIMIVGSITSGFTLQFARDAETVIDAQFKAQPSDTDGTLIVYREEDKKMV